MDGDTYQRWVAGYDVDTGVAKGRLVAGPKGVRFAEVVVNGPKTWSLAAALDPEISAAYDAAQTRAAEQIIGWVAQQATTRVGPRDKQVQVPVERIEAAVIAHHTSGPVTRTVTSICRSTPASSLRRSGAGCTRSGCGTRSLRSTGSGTPR
jgi:exodeoxyribonuclease V alpha subunit